MLSPNELKKGVQFIYNNQPYEVINLTSIFKGRGQSVTQAKIKNLITGNILSKTFHPGDELKEADIEKIKLRFIYSRKENFVFSEINNPSKRFSLTERTIGIASQFLKPNEIVEGLEFNKKIVNIKAPIKVLLKVISAPPGIRRGRAEAGTKQVVLETGAKVNVPLFIKEGDIIEVNSETGEYTRRVETS
ncbi:hypothetical protein J7J81_01590 [bacterium]|nr:hypothetical protein [bacterium]